MTTVLKIARAIFAVSIAASSLLSLRGASAAFGIPPCVAVGDGVAPVVVVVGGVCVCVVGETLALGVVGALGDGSWSPEQAVNVSTTAKAVPHPRTVMGAIVSALWPLTNCLCTAHLNG